MDPESEAANHAPIGRYANYFEIGFNAFEFVLDFAQRYGDGEPGNRTRIVTGPAYAKALYGTLAQALQRFERTYGPIGADTGEPDDRS
jgi:hypothetical protein